MHEHGIIELAKLDIAGTQHLNKHVLKSLFLLTGQYFQGKSIFDIPAQI